eukprot:3403171-Ditylum_brightwellii.AAC.1
MMTLPSVPTLPSPPSPQTKAHLFPPPSFVLGHSYSSSQCKSVLTEIQSHDDKPQPLRFRFLRLHLFFPHASHHQQ